MQIKRQNTNENVPRPPSDTNASMYGEIVADIDGRMYCRNKQGRFVSLASSATVASTAESVVGLPSIGASVPSNAVFSDHTYEVEPGDENGTIKISYRVLGPVSTGQPTGSYDVAITGLGTAAYHQYEDFMPSGSSSSDFVTSDVLESILRNDTQSTTINATALQGSSLQDIIDLIDLKIEQALG